MAGAWPGHKGVGGTGNVLPALAPSEKKRLNATHAVVTGGAVLWLSKDPSLQTFDLAGPLGLPPTPAPNVRFCGDVHVFRHGNKWRVAGAGSNGLCMSATNASISPLLLLYETDALTVPPSASTWKFVSVLYKGAPGDGPRVECPTYIPSAKPGGVAVLLFSKTGTDGVCPPGALDC